MTDWDKTLPDGTQPLRVGDDVIRANNDALEARYSAEHYFPDNSDANRQGRHKFSTGGDATARDAAITSPAVGMLFLRSDTRALVAHNGTDWFGSAAMVGTSTARAAVTDAEDGTLWYDTDNGAVYLSQSGTWGVINAARESQYDRVKSDRVNGNTQDLSAGVLTEVLNDDDTVTETATFSVPDVGTFVMDVFGAVSVNTDSGSGGNSSDYGIRIVQDPTGADVETDEFLFSHFRAADNPESYHTPMSHRFETLVNGEDYVVRLLAYKNSAASGDHKLGSYGEQLSNSYLQVKLIQTA